MTRFIITLPLAAGEAGKEGQTMLDTIIRNGTVIDGTGAAPGFRADVAIQDGRIAAVGDLTGREARQEVDAAGLTVTPGVYRHTPPRRRGCVSPGFGAAELCQA